MKTITLYVFCDEMMKEYRLSENAEGVVNILLISKGIEHFLPVMAKNGRWSIAGSEEFKLLANGSAVNDKELVAEDIIEINFSDKTGKTVIYVVQDTETITFHKYNCGEKNKISIGCSEESIIQYKAPSVAASHALLSISSGLAEISLKGQNYLYINGVRTNSAVLNYGDVVSIVGLKIVYLESILAINHGKGFIKCTLPPFNKSEVQKSHEINKTKTGILDDQMVFQRSPRIIRNLEEDELDVDSPPPPNVLKEQPLLLTIGPSLLMGMVMMFSVMFTLYASKNNPAMAIPGIVMAGAMLVGAVLWPFLSRMYNKFTNYKEEKTRVKRYRKYIQKIYAQVEEKIDHNRKVSSNTYPEPTICINRVINKDRRLWERTPANNDFLDIRLGKGTRPSLINVKVPRERFTMVDDPMLDELKEVNNNFKLVPNMPITISLLKNNMVGMIGDRNKLIDVAKCMLVEVAGLHSYDEVKIVCIYKQKESEAWEWVKRLPHVWGSEKSIRFMAATRDESREVLLYLNELLSEREENKESSHTEQVTFLPHFVVLIVDPELVEDEPVMRYLTSSAGGLGVTTIFLYEKMNLLPKECKTFIQCNEAEYSVYDSDNAAGEMVEFKPDSVIDQDLDGFSRSLAAIKIKEIASSQSIPPMLTFLEMYKVGRIEHLDIRRRWRENLSYRSLEAPLGIKAGDTTFYLNIHEKYHGPHGLVAGMTGSGKSEFIQSYILSMAVNYHPYDVSFILIDYKGGGMANCFEGLPHVSGTITNLGGSQIRRSLVSLDSELKRRQRIFAEYGVNHIDKYQQLYKEHKANEPIPHLIIISDEFAELKSQQPEFMQELVSTARIGRSLGVHLILATQKPSGVVDDQIWSNTRFRVCLKVLDKNDSNEMLKKPEAAYLIQPGRCYVQVGNDEIFELLQSGWSGAPYVPVDKVENDEEKQVMLIDGCARALKTMSCKAITAKSNQSQLSAVVDYLSDLAAKEGLKELKLWLEPLKETIYLDEIEQAEGGWDGQHWSETDHWMCPVIGLLDDPKNQTQLPLKVNLGSDGHVALFGAPGTGKTIFLQTLIYSLVTSYSPEIVSIYILDFGGRTMGYFSELPHVGGVVFSDEEEKLDKLLKLLFKELESRKKAFAVYGVGTLKAYMEATDKKMPALVVILDNYAAFTELYPDFEPSIVTLSRDGGNYGIYLVLTGSSTNAIKYKITQNFKAMYTLQLNDKYDYVSVVGQTNGLEPEPVPGRGLVKLSVPLEYQTALACRAANDAERVYQLKMLFKEMNEKWEGRRAKPIPFIPEELTVDLMLEDEEVCAKAEEGLLPIGYDTEEVEVVSLDYRNTFTYPILGFDETGKTNLLKTLIRIIKWKFDWQVYVVDSQGGGLRKYCHTQGVNGYISDVEEFDNFINILFDEIKLRHGDLKAFRENESTSEKEYEYMQKYQRIVVLIDNFDSFYGMISEKALELMENIVKHGDGLQVYFIVTGNPERISRYAGSALYTGLFKGTYGIMLGGKFDMQNIFNVNMSFQQKNAQFDAGFGYLIEKNSYKIIRTPQA